MQRPLRIKLLRVSLINSSLQPLAPGKQRPHRNLSTIDRNDSNGFLEKRAIPASFLETPRSDEHTVLHHYRPDANDAMRLRAGANSQNLPVANGRHHLFRETSR